MESYTFCSEMKEIKTLLTYILSAIGGSNSRDDLIVQYPESTKKLELAAGDTYEKSVTINRRLRYICVSVPENCTLEIQNDNSTIMWFTGEAGTMEPPTGCTINEMGIKVQNVGSEDCRWSCRMIFS